MGIGRVDAVIADGVIARYLMTKEPGKYKIVEGTDYGVDNFAVGFRKDDTALRDKINGILAEMKKMVLLIKSLKNGWALAQT